jgi:hypothetical protein
METRNYKWHISVTADVHTATFMELLIKNACDTKRTYGIPFVQRRRGKYLEIICTNYKTYILQESIVSHGLEVLQITGK